MFRVCELKCFWMPVGNYVTRGGRKIRPFEFEVKLIFKINKDFNQDFNNILGGKFKNFDFY